MTHILKMWLKIDHVESHVMNAFSGFNRACCRLPVVLLAVTNCNVKLLSSGLTTLYASAFPFPCTDAK